MTTPVPGYRPENVELMLGESQQKIEQMKAATALTQSLKEMTPLINDVSTLVKDLTASYINYRSLFERMEDNKDLRARKFNALNQELERQHRQIEMLFSRLDKVADPTRQLFEETLVKLLDTITSLSLGLLEIK
jgi:hypothetical protein